MKIKGLFFENDMAIIVGDDATRIFHIEGTISKIVRYNENGEMAPVAYYHVFVGEKMISNVNGKYVQRIDYFED